MGRWPRARPPIHTTFSPFLLNARGPPYCEQMARSGADDPRLCFFVVSRRGSESGPWVAEAVLLFALSSGDSPPDRSTRVATKVGSLWRLPQDREIQNHESATSPQAPRWQGGEGCAFTAKPIPQTNWIRGGAASKVFLVDRDAFVCRSLPPAPDHWPPRPNRPPSVPFRPLDQTDRPLHTRPRAYQESWASRGPSAGPPARPASPPPLACVASDRSRWKGFAPKDSAARPRSVPSVSLGEQPRSLRRRVPS